MYSFVIVSEKNSKHKCSRKKMKYKETQCRKRFCEDAQVAIGDEATYAFGMRI